MSKLLRKVKKLKKEGYLRENTLKLYCIYYLKGEIERAGSTFDEKFRKDFNLVKEYVEHISPQFVFSTDLNSKKYLYCFPNVLNKSDISLDRDSIEVFNNLDWISIANIDSYEIKGEKIFVATIKITVFDYISYSDGTYDDDRESVSNYIKDTKIKNSAISILLTHHVNRTMLDRLNGSIGNTKEVSCIRTFMTTYIYRYSMRKFEVANLFNCTIDNGSHRMAEELSFMPFDNFVFVPRVLAVYNIIYNEFNDIDIYKCYPTENVISLSRYMFILQEVYGYNDKVRIIDMCSHFIMPNYFYYYLKPVIDRAINEYNNKRIEGEKIEQVKQEEQDGQDDQDNKEVKHFSVKLSASIFKDIDTLCKMPYSELNKLIMNSHIEIPDNWSGTEKEFKDLIMNELRVLRENRR